jgi:hypothetical protein
LEVVEQVEFNQLTQVQMEVLLYFQQLHLQVVEVDQVIVVLLRNFQEDLEVQEVELWNQVQQV